MTPSTTHTHEIVFERPHQVRLNERALPPLAPGQVRIQGDYSAISAGTEKLLYLGQIPEHLNLDATLPGYTSQNHYPTTYGYSHTGTVVECGPSVDSHLKDKRVFSFAPHATQIQVEAESVVELPDALPSPQATLLANMETAISLLMDGAPVVGERIAVMGLGIVGQLTAALLKQQPLHEVTAFDNCPYRVSIAQQSGIDAKAPPEAADDLEPFDLIFELTGNPAALDSAISMTRFEGRIVVGSWYGTKTHPLQLGAQFHRRRIQLLSSQVSHIASRYQGRFSKQRRLGVALQALVNTPCEHLLSHRYPLHQAHKAYHQLTQTPNQTMQILFDLQERPSCINSD